MNWIAGNLVQVLLVVGLALLAIEVVVLGFSTFMLFFVGLAAVVTSGLIFIGVIPDSILAAVICCAVLTALAALLLWKPLSKLQNNVEKQAVTSDLVGHTFVLTDSVSPSKPGKHKYSGIEWQVISEVDIAAGTKVRVSRTDVGIFYIEADPS